MVTERGTFPYRGTDAIIPPGEVLQEELAARNMTQQDLARAMGRPPRAINEIIHGRKALTTRTALELEKVLGVSAQLWLRLEASYRLALERRRLAAS